MRSSLMLRACLGLAARFGFRQQGRSLQTLLRKLCVLDEEEARFGEVWRVVCVSVAAALYTLPLMDRHARHLSRDPQPGFRAKAKPKSGGWRDH